ncbi:hypothetical protein CI109_103316 [Kwoniella shandongensis]|uniref:Histidine kinase n=1 Tax=Kwoniella shandongensis TaxID=1734106 RepID=A0AAJ8LKG4_9TREE
MFGRSAKSPEAWGPVWDGVASLIDRCLSVGEPCFREDDLLLYRRGPRGHYIEKYHTWSFVPLFDSDRKPLGLYNPTRETTPSVLARRRQETMRDLSEQLLTARNTHEYYDGIAEVVDRNATDVPFLMCYNVDDVSEGKFDLTLQSTTGVPLDHSSAPSQLHINISSERSRFALPGHLDHRSSPATSGLSSGGSRVIYSYDKTSWPIAKALATRQCVVIDDCTDLVKGFPLRQWDSLPESAIVIPICSETSIDTPRAVLIMGLNLLSLLDSPYEEWIHVMRAHLTSSIVSVRAYEAEHTRQTEKDRMERAKTAWFQGAAHDLRSPLTLVAGPLDDVLRTTLSKSQRQALSLAQRNLSRVQRLVTALLDFSRIEAGKLTGRFVPIDLGLFVSDLAALFRPAVERRRIRYDVEIEEHDGMVFVDPTLLETVITNLLSNALKYTEAGRIVVKLSYNTHAEIAIIDSGFGIPSEELASVTDRFHRATSALSRGTEGTGIGLALAKEIIRLHGGDLLIQSQTAEETGGPHGSIFTAQIPLLERQTLEDGFARTALGSYSKEVVEEAMHWIGNDSGSEPVSSATSDSSIEGYQRADSFLFERDDVLLLVDDNNDLRHYVKQIFAPHCKVIEASNGLEALAKARANTPHLILSDLMMPKMNGQELLEAIRRDSRTCVVPMVLLSAATNDELRVQALLAGAEDFMIKPFKPKELLARVHLHMQMGKKRAHLESLYAQRQREMAVLSEYCPSGILRADATGSLTYANAAWRESAGVSTRDDLNAWRDFVDTETYHRLIDQWDEIVNGDQRETQLVWKWLNGRTVSGTFIRLDLVDRGMSGVIGCISDITHQEEKLLEAERRRIEAEESKHQQELLVDLTSHEIRTPVSAILQCSSLAKENLVELGKQFRLAGPNGLKPTAKLLEELEEDIEALESIYQCGLVQERIANDVLSLARIQLDMLSIHAVEMDLKMEARKMKKIELVLDFGPNVQRTGQVTLMTDHVRLGQVVTNLLSNAIRFTASSLTRRIKVRYDVSSRPPADDTCEAPNDDETVNFSTNPEIPVWLYISVTDTGPGLGPDEQAALFRRFSRISELLGGRIEMRSQLGVGSVADNGLIALDKINKRHRIGQGSTLDNARKYDAVLMDLEMPVMDGLTAIRQIRRLELEGALDEQLVIALTGNARQGQIDQAIAAGMDDGESARP